MIKLSVIIVSYNTVELTVQTVRSVLTSLAADDDLSSQMEIIVVDNDSTDDTIKILKQIKDRRLKIYNTGQNLGFGRGNNFGLARAHGQYILFLNSDTVVKPGSLSRLLIYYQKHQAEDLGLLAAQLLNPDDTYQPQGGDLPTLGSVANTMFFLDDLPLIGQHLSAVQHTGRRFDAQEIDQQLFVAKGWVAGTAVMVARQLLDQFGFWDEQIFMYGEDQELSYRLHCLGYHHGILTNAPIVHFGSASAGSKNAIVGEIKGYFYFWRKYRPDWQLPILRLILWLAMWWRAIIYRLLKNDVHRAQIYSSVARLVPQM